MITENAYSFIHIGLQIRFLSALSSKTKIQSFDKGLNTLKTILESAGLFVSTVACDSIIEDFKLKIHSKNATDEIGNDIHSFLTINIRSLENTVYAESSTKLVYLIPNRKYNGSYLLSDPSKLLSENTFEKLSTIAKDDFTHACKCLLYGEGTASAFHLLRATEETLKNYYCFHIKTKRLKKPMWGPMTEQLRNKKKNRPKDSLLISLDVVRTTYRNPTQHPEATYTVDEAESLFGLCIDVINQMTKEL